MPLKPDRPVPTEPEQLSCTICLRDIPPSVAQTLEGPDYVHHFCGIECLELWHREPERGQKDGDETSRPIEGEGQDLAD